MSNFLYITEDEGEMLTDGSTESCTESPTAEECKNSDTFESPPCQTDDSTIMIDIGSNKDDFFKVICNSLNGLKCDSTVKQHVVDKPKQDFSMLQKPSILRRSSDVLENKEYSEKVENQKGRQVSFPDDASALAIYREPENSAPWKITKQLSTTEILEKYKNSCKLHRAVEIDAIKKQISDFKNNVNRTSVLNVSSIQVTTEVCETLEDMFKIVNFQRIYISECKFTQETVQEFLNILEYYEPTTELIVSDSFNDLEAWRKLCEYISKSNYLQSIKFKNMIINEQYMRFFLLAVNINTVVTSLCFDSCNLDKTPSYLIENLRNNTSIQELYLLQLGLYTKEAECLGRYLSNNSLLQVLDLSNNFIGDRGLEALSYGLGQQTNQAVGLSILILVNNQLTEKCGHIINSIISSSRTIRTLNIGYNNLTDKVIQCIQEGLSNTTCLEGLGLQSTLLTCSGAFFLAESIEANKSLEKINLKGNKAIQCPGLERICKALTNSKITKVELDEHNRSCNNPQGYAEIVKKINGICTINKSLQEQKVDEDSPKVPTFSCRKISLNCEPRYTLPPFYCEQDAAKSTTSTSKHRFNVFKVSETCLHGSPITTTSRFKVFSVPASSKDRNESNTGNQF